MLKRWQVYRRILAGKPKWKRARLLREFRHARNLSTSAEHLLAREQRRQELARAMEGPGLEGRENRPM